MTPRTRWGSIYPTATRMKQLPLAKKGILQSYNQIHEGVSVSFQPGLSNYSYITGQYVCASPVQAPASSCETFMVQIDWASAIQ
jgi:hypothetical protein